MNHVRVWAVAIVGMGVLLVEKLGPAEVFFLVSISMMTLADCTEHIAKALRASRESQP